jgi:hypothetical protein
MFRDRKYLFEYTSIGGGEGRKQFLSAVPSNRRTNQLQIADI